jgi:hypothetical protein
MNAALICTMVVYFVSQLNNMATSCSVELKQADMAMITPDDYTIGIDLPEGMYDKFV